MSEWGLMHWQRKRRRYIIWCAPIRANKTKSEYYTDKSFQGNVLTWYTFIFIWSLLSFKRL